MNEYLVDCNDDELVHYGVLGMKWGVRRASYKRSQNERLARKAIKQDKKSAKYTIQSEKAHAKYDLGESNKAATKAAKQKLKAAKLEKKALNADDEFTKTRLQKKASKAKYKSSVNKTEADRLSKEIGYGEKAMGLSIKSDKAAAKAAKYRHKMANNDYYIKKMNRKISSLTPEEYERGRSYIERYLNN